VGQGQCGGACRSRWCGARGPGSVQPQSQAHLPNTPVSTTPRPPSALPCQQLVVRHDAAGVLQPGKMTFMAAAATCGPSSPCHARLLECPSPALLQQFVRKPPPQSQLARVLLRQILLDALGNIGGGTPRPRPAGGDLKGGGRPRPTRRGETRGGGGTLF
jgi:hypothetical protein